MWQKILPLSICTFLFSSRWITQRLCESSKYTELNSLEIVIFFKSAFVLCCCSWFFSQTQNPLISLADKRTLKFKAPIKLYCPLCTAPPQALFPVLSEKEGTRQPVITVAHNTTWMQNFGFQWPQTDAPSLLWPYGHFMISPCSLILASLHCS